MARFERLVFFGASLVGGAACTLTGLGTYEVATCSTPVGTTSTVQMVGQLLAAPTISSINGTNSVGAFIAGTGCGEAVVAGDESLSSECIFANQSPAVTTLLPQQPFVMPIGTGFAAVGVATTAPCTQGQLTFAQVGGGSVSPSQAACATGAALPSVFPAPDGSDAFVAWYETPITSRADPIQSCAGASAAPLMLALASGATSLSPSLGSPTTLTTQSVSVRPAAMTGLVGTSQVLVAAPDGNAVSVWALSSAQSPGSPVTVAGLAGARAVSIASATDGSGRIAVVAELGCSPQEIALAVGTVSRGFAQVRTVAPAGGTFAVQPTVAWVAQGSYWMVSWISGSGGAHALAERFDSNGNAVGGVIDPSAPALAATVNAAGNGSLFAYTQPMGGSGSFESVSLGCE